MKVAPDSFASRNACYAFYSVDYSLLLGIIIGSSYSWINSKLKNLQFDVQDMAFEPRIVPVTPSRKVMGHPVVPTGVMQILGKQGSRYEK